MTDGVKRIDPERAWEEMQSSSPPHLVCVYPREKHRTMEIEGSMAMEEFERRRDGLPKDARIVFY